MSPYPPVKSYRYHYTTTLTHSKSPHSENIVAFLTSLEERLRIVEDYNATCVTKMSQALGSMAVVLYTDKLHVGLQYSPLYDITCNSHQKKIHEFKLIK